MSKIPPILLSIASVTFFCIFYQYGFYFMEQEHFIVYNSSFWGGFLNFPAICSNIIGELLIQFCYYKFVGPIISTLLLIGIFYLIVGAISNKIIKKISIIFVIFCWFMCLNNLFSIINLISILGGASLYYIYKKFPKLGFLVLILAFWLFGGGFIITLSLMIIDKLKNLLYIIMCIGFGFVGSYFYDINYWDSINYKCFESPKLPSLKEENLRKAIVEYHFKHYQKCEEISKENIEKDIAFSMLYNMCLSQKGELANQIVGQKNVYLGTLEGFTQKTGYLLGNIMADFYLLIGDITMAERSNLICMAMSQNKRNSRNIKNLAEISKIKNDSLELKKYISILNQTLIYKKWAKNLEEKDFSEKTSMINTQDFINFDHQAKPRLRQLIMSNPNNKIAIDYLLCTDILEKNQEEFKEDFYNIYIKDNKNCTTKLYIDYLNSLK